ncbi:MAG: cohesin domain-containing protein [Oscillospiraceae bacterium]
MDVSTDKTVTIPVTVKNNPGFAVGGFNVEYDTTALTFTSAELVADFTNISTNKKTPGNIGVFVERDKNYTEDGVLLNLKFTVTDSAQNGGYLR